MRFVVLFLVLALGVGLFVYPPLLEGTDGECSALEQRVSDLASHDSSGRLSVGALYGSSSSNPSGAAYSKDHYPLLPPAVGCVLVYWRTAIDPRFLMRPAAPATAPADRPSPSRSEVQPAAEPKRANAGTPPIIARGMTPNGDPILPGPLFTLPMDSVAIRVAYPGSAAGPARFRLLQGRALIASCNAQRGASGTAWCKFDVALRKGNYSIAMTASNALLGQYPFTVVGN